MWQKWIEVNDLSSGQYFVNKDTKIKTLMLRSDLRDYSDAYIVIKGAVTLKGTRTNNRTEFLLFHLITTY